MAGIRDSRVAGTGRKGEFGSGFHPWGNSWPTAEGRSVGVESRGQRAPTLELLTSDKRNDSRHVTMDHCGRTEGISSGAAFERGSRPSAAVSPAPALGTPASQSRRILLLDACPAPSLCRF